MSVLQDNQVVTKDNLLSSESDNENIIPSGQDSVQGNDQVTGTLVTSKLEQNVEQILDVAKFNMIIIFSIAIMLGMIGGFGLARIIWRKM